MTNQSAPSAKGRNDDLPDIIHRARAIDAGRRRGDSFGSFPANEALDLARALVRLADRESVELFKDAVRGWELVAEQEVMESEGVIQWIEPHVRGVAIFRGKGNDIMLRLPELPDSAASSSRDATRDAADIRLLNAITALIEEDVVHLMEMDGWDELSLALHSHPLAGREIVTGDDA